MRTIVYVDGFNLYYGSLKGTPHKWLDLCAYFRAALPPGCVLQLVKYCTAAVSPHASDPDAAKRQDVYLRGLKANNGAAVEIVKGHFKTKEKTLPLVTPPPRFAKVIVSEEKGSDVNLAVHLVNDGWHDRFDCAAIVSNDSDLELGLSIVKRELRKRVLLFTPGDPTVRFPVRQLTRWSHKQLTIDPAILAACQLPNPIPGTNLTKPLSW